MPYVIIVVLSKALCEIYGTFQTPPGKQNFKDNNNLYAIFENRAQLFVFPQPNLYAFIQHKRGIEKEKREVVVLSQELAQVKMRDLSPS
jgi:hypothetical protein